MSLHTKNDARTLADQRRLGRHNYRNTMRDLGFSFAKKDANFLRC